MSLRCIITAIDTKLRTNISAKYGTFTVYSHQKMFTKVTTKFSYADVSIMVDPLELRLLTQNKSGSSPDSSVQCTLLGQTQEFKRMVKLPR